MMHDWIFMATLAAVVASLFYLTLVRPKKKDK
jgi:hypothetical protein